MTMMRHTCARHEFILVVLHAAFNSMGRHYALGNVLLIGKCFGISLKQRSYMSILVAKSMNAIAAR